MKNSGINKLLYFSFRVLCLLIIFNSFVSAGKAQQPTYKYVAWSSEDIIAIADDDRVYLYDTSLALLGVLDVVTDNNDGITIAQIDWSPDGNKLAVVLLDLVTGRSLTGNLVEIWNINTQQQELQIVDVNANLLAWSPDSQLIAVNRNFTGEIQTRIRIIDVNTGNDVKSWIAYQGGYPSQIAWHPKLPKIALATGTIDIWSIASDPPVLETTFGISNPSSALLYSVSGNRIAFGGQTTNSVEIYDTQTYQPVYILSGHQRFIRTLDWVDETLVSSTLDDTTRIWNTANGQNIMILPEYMSSLAISPDGKKFAAVIKSQYSTVIYETNTGKVLAQLSDDHLGTPNA
jgi:WD40 repeat protein